MKKRILIIDDEQDLTFMLKLRLEIEGYYNVYEENDATLALKTSRAVEPDLIMLDMMMPHVTGSDVAAMLMNDPRLRDVPVLFMTGLVSEDEAPLGWLDREGRTFIPKCLPMENLIRCIEEKIRGNQRVATKVSA